MVKTLTQTVEFDAPPEELFELVLDSKKHSEATGGGAKMSRKVGGAYSAWDGYITGKNLGIVDGRLIVQSWRASEWTDDDPDSVLVLAFSATKKGGRVDMVHANVPDEHAEALDDGWRENYWAPWKAYLEERKG